MDCEIKRTQKEIEGMTGKYPVIVLTLRDENGKCGVGEAALVGKRNSDFDFLMSREDAWLEHLLRESEFDGKNLLAFPSLRFALETALMRLRSRRETVPGRTEKFEAAENSPAGNTVPAALGKELDGVNMPVKKKRLLKQFKPQIIFLNPAFHGGFSGCEQWMKFAKETGTAVKIEISGLTNEGAEAVAEWLENLIV